MALLGLLQSRISAYAKGFAYALVGLAMQWAIYPMVGPRVPFLFFLPLLAVASATLGPGPAFLILAVGFANALYWLKGSDASWAVDGADQVSLLVYLGVGLMLALWGARVRVTGRRAALAEERLKLAQSDTGVGLFEVDFQLKTVFVSPAMTQLLGQPPTSERITLEEWISMLPPDEVQKGSEALKRRLRDGVAGYEREHRIELPNGQVRWLLSRVHIERGLSGHARRVRGASVDITHRKELEAMLRQARDDLTMQVADLQRLHELSSQLLELPNQQAQLQAILVAVADFHGARQGVLSLYDASMDRLVVNSSLGFSAHARDRMSLLSLGEGSHGAAFVERRRVVLDDIAAGSVVSEFVALARVEGIRAMHSTPLMGSSGEVLGVLSMCFDHPRRPSEREMRLADICARKAALFVERSRALAALHEADRRKDEFLATLAHELRNPLAPIRQAAVISNAPTATESQKRWSHAVIERQVQQMALLLDDLLDVSRITRGALHLRKTTTTVSALADAAVETVRPLLDSRKHRLDVEIPGEALAIECDPLRIAQVVANLLANAAKYTEPGGHVVLSARRVGNEIEIQVTDNGIGLRQEAMNEIFEMFTQVRASDDRSAGGLGIGLALAKGLVGLHGGIIVATSEGPGRGSTFIVRLPVGQTATASVGTTQPKGAAPAESRRVLVADDNRDAAESLAELLRLNGHEVAVAFDGETALSEFLRFQPDVALLDIGMPKLDGNAVAGAIRRSPSGKNTTLVAVTGWGQEKDRSEAIAAGFDHHMTKPVDLERVQRLLSEREVRAPSPWPA